MAVRNATRCHKCDSPLIAGWIDDRPYCDLHLSWNGKKINLTANFLDFPPAILIGGGMLLGIGLGYLLFKKS